MSSQSLLIVFCVVCLMGVGCGGATESDAPYLFLGVPENETSGEGPVGLLNGESIRVNDVTAVREAPYEEYLEAKQALKIVGEDNHNGHIYWAVKVDRDIPYENATAMVTVLERYRSKSE